MSKKKTEGADAGAGSVPSGPWFECEMGNFTGVPGEHLTATANTTFNKLKCQQLAKMVDFKCLLQEPDRGAPRPPLGEIYCEVIDFKISKGPKKQNGMQDKEIRIRLKFGWSKVNEDAIFQIAEASPATFILQITDQQLTLDAAAPGGDDRQTDIEDE